MGPCFRRDDIIRHLWSNVVKKRTPSPLAILSLAALMSSTSGLYAADVTYERLLHPEPQNWLMNHHDYSAQRYSALSAINKANVKGLRLSLIHI